MKKSSILFLMVFFFLSKVNFGQCNYTSITPINIGQVIVDTAFCPSGGRITLNNVTGGGGYFVYEIIDGPVIRIIQSQNVFNALPVGNYRLRVTSCNGTTKDTVVNVANGYTPIYVSNWRQTIERISGLVCGVTNDGIYKIKKPTFPGGTSPYKIQISATSNFLGVMYEPGFDSAVFTSLNQSSTYYVRITDACNNFSTTSFVTPSTTPVTPLSVPTLSFSRVYWTASCSGNETIAFSILDSATGVPYNVNYLYSNKVFWGNKSLPYLRIRVENAVSNYVYADRHIAANNFSGVYNLSTNLSYSGETGLAAPGNGFLFYGYPMSETNTLPQMYCGSEFPPNAPLRITIYFPGGDHCGTTILPYSKTFLYSLGTHATTQALITNVITNCSVSLASYFRADFNMNFFQGTLTLIDPSPNYKVLTSNTIYPGSNTFSTISYSPLVIGHNYRVILQDTCGRKDSMDVVYNPGISEVLPPTISDTVTVNYTCPANPNDSIYTIKIRPLPTGYNVVSASIEGFGTVAINAIPNWNGTTQTGYKLNKLLAPGNYIYKIVWLNQCQKDTVTQAITISPILTPPEYSRAITLGESSSTQSCSSNGFTSIRVDGFIKNTNTNYSFSNLRLISVPNSYVFPISLTSGGKIDSLNTSLYFYTTTSEDSLKIGTGYSGIYINSGQNGNYTFAIDIVCPNGAIVETISATYNVIAATPFNSTTPSLRNSNALICDNITNDARINLLPTGGTRPFYFEYKLETSATYLPTGNSGLDSVAIISPLPTPGTIYDVRVVDFCGKTATSKVSVANFSGAFYIFQYPQDCANNPFDVTVATSSVNGGVYTWRRNGTIVAQGVNVTSYIVNNASVDTISVDVDMFGCYYRSVTRVIAFTNPCGFVILPIKPISIIGTRISENKVALSWATTESESINQFKIEKSIDGVNFISLANVASRTTNASELYKYLDEEVRPIAYYRLRILDKEGKIAFSNIIKVENEIASQPNLIISPNPASKEITIQLISKNTSDCVASIYDTKGLLITKLNINGTAISQGKNINIEYLPKGIYILSVRDFNGNVSLSKFVKK